MLRPFDPLLITLAAVPPESRVLDAGCGEGVHTQPLAQLGFDVWACDSNETAVEKTRDRIGETIGREEAVRRVAHARPDALGYPDGYFHWVVAHLTLDALTTESERVDTLAELQRVMYDGAWLFVTSEVMGEGEVQSVGEVAGLAVARRPRKHTDGPGEVTWAVFRKVGSDTIG
ncbi:hypothetical protein BH23BAC4_BH23BAC4_03850 [soil metagenome]